MTGAQQASHAIQELTLAERQKENALREKHRNIQDELRREHEKAYREHQTKQGKVGALDKVPTAEELKVAAPIVAKALGLDPTDPLLSDVDITNPKKFTQATPALVSVVSQAKQILHSNKAITGMPQAIAMAVKQAKDNGEFSTTPGQEFSGLEGIFKKDIPAKTEFSAKGDTPDASIEVKHGMNDADLIQGKYYSYGGKTYQARDGKLYPVK